MSEGESTIEFWRHAARTASTNYDVCMMRDELRIIIAEYDRLAAENAELRKRLAEWDSYNEAAAEAAGLD